MATLQDRHQLFNSGQETLVIVNGDAPEAVGSGAVIVMNGPEGVKPDAFYVGPSGTGIEAHKQAIEDDRIAAGKAGAQLFDDTQRTQESGEARTHQTERRCSCQEGEAQDEGAAAIVDRLVDNIACATQNRALLVGDPAEDKVMTEAIRDNALQEIERILNPAHQSPTPAADADRVRIEDDLREARAIITETVEEFGCTIDLYNKHGPHWTSADGEMFYVGVVLDREPLIERGRAFLAALKSTAAKEGG